MSDEHRRAIEAVAATLAGCPHLAVEIDGYTDNSGAAGFNRDLSARRAVLVADYLGRFGIDTGRISVAGHGDSHPIASNDTRDGRARNRRVELVLRPTH